MNIDRIRALREDADWSQQDLADMLHINRRTYGAYENGINAIPLDILVKLTDIYKTSVDYLLGLTDVRDPYPRKK
ncbi:MAG: helix-turn-helix transcriptional regulator [Oscillibacter sp.]|nr:helix-turn-helix transcriptional regulator [Oscillibacter sp.]